jgi:hypothetical protein
MKGVRYIVDDKGRKTAVVLDLKVHGELWEDIHDVLVVRKRRNEPTAPLDDVMKRLKKLGKLK